jgi:uncharacterized protein (TIGR02246 family)
MAAIDLARDYIARVNGREGAAAAALFMPDGVIVDPAGHQHQGREAIAAFVNAAAPRTVSRIAGREIGEHRVVFSGTVQTGHLAPAEIEWTFDVEDDRIKRLMIRHPRVGARR